MLNTKKLKKVTVTLAASLIVTFSIPAGISHAATITPESQAVSSSGLLQSIFERVGLQLDGKASDVEKIKAKPISNSSEDSVNRTPVSNPSENSTNLTPVSNPTTTPTTSPTADESNKEQTTNLALADQIIKTGEKYLGTPYKFGAPSGQTNVFDCSSFVQYVYGKHGIDLPRTSRQQSKVGTTVPRSQLQKGDLMFFKTSSSGGEVGHVGIYAGDNKILHTWGPGGVRYDSLSTPWLKEGFLVAKRVIK